MRSKAAKAPGRRGHTRVLAGLLVLLALAGAGWLAGLGRFPARGAALTAPPVPTGTAPVIRTDVVSRQQVPGTIGFASRAPVHNQLPAGVLTWLPAPGAVIRRGQPLFDVNGQPVILFYGKVPAWRALTLGISGGADVRELQRNLAALGADPYHLMAPGEQFSAATTAAVVRWQLSQHLPPTGVAELGQVVFSPGPVRVTAVDASLGGPVAPGTQVLAVSATTPQVRVNLDPAFQSLVHLGSPVLISLPATGTLRGQVTAISPVAVAAAAGGSGGPAGAAIPVTIRLDQPRAAGHLDQAPVQVAITTQQANGVLAVPISALLARPGGGYAVELVQGARHRRVPVALGLFDDTAGLVQVQGPPALRPGARVEVPAP